MTTALQTIDATLDPLLKAANRVRQVRDALPESMWHFVPEVIRVPLDELFTAVELFDRELGRLEQDGLFKREGSTLS